MEDEQVQGQVQGQEEDEQTTLHERTKRQLLQQLEREHEVG